MSATEKLPKDRIDPRNIPEAIRQEAILGVLFARVPEAIVLLDTEDRVLQVNQEFTKIFGYAQEEACGHLINELVVPEELSAEADEYTRRGLRGENVDVETVRKHKDGTRVHVSIISGPVSISGSQISEYVIYREITERKRAEEALQKSERNLAAIINTIPTTAWTARPDGYCDFLNQGWLDYTGLTAEKAQGWGWAEAIHPDDRKRLIEEWHSCLASGTPVDTEARTRRFDNSYRWFLIRANPLKDESGNILKWYGTNIDIEDRKRGEEDLRARELSWREIVDNIPGLVATMGAMGEVEFLNRQTLEYFGKTNEELKNWALTDAIHPDDLPRIIEARIKSIEQGRIYDVEHRCRRADGVYRWFQVRGLPVRDTENKIAAWYLLLTDIDDRKRAEQKLLQSEADFRTIINNIPGFVHTMSPTGEVEFLNQQILEFFGKSSEELKDWTESDVCHPDDLPRVLETFRRSFETGQICDVELRCRRADGVYRWFQSRGRPVRNAEGQITAWYFLLTDIDDRKRAEQKLRESEQDLRTITDTIPQPIVVLSPDGRTLYVNQVALDLTGFTIDLLDERGFWSRVVHADDVNRLRTERQERLLRGDAFELEFRALFKNGQYRWQLMQYNPLKNESGQIIRWYSTATDIDDRKRAEEKLRQSEEELRTIADTIRQFIVVLAPDGTTLYANKVALENTGLTVRDLTDENLFTHAGMTRPASVPGEPAWSQVWWLAAHPDDRERIQAERRDGFSRGIAFEMEARMLFKTGQYRWQLFEYNPLKDESGQIIRWYCTGTDMDDQKRAEERLRNENLVLREEIDRSSMFEEIVGSSKPMSQMLKKVEKVAPSDSTVLILGETGTGKELIARALHRRSKRASRAFVKVNCAAIPQSLIASELFGHEKGAFTGALQRRLGRFEAANGGTLFLDEIGELPMETQIALLRVLQEREFERVGSNHPISVDVRVIAATNRDLRAAVADGNFRQDLFFRLNVFPISVPPLRERVEDISLLVEYFVGRFAKESGKRIRHISKDTLEQLKGYNWPGNIRELQNVIERAVILCETDTFLVDESWLERESGESSQGEGLSALADREVEMIEAALAETHGRISGPTGAAAKLGIPRQTLESKIRRLGIDKYGQKRPTST
jgi:formate hydrogenlyase transcriptional activator